jgi:hypothetical protein
VIRSLSKNLSAEERKSQLIIKTDVDIVFSDKLIDYLEDAVTVGNGVVSLCANIQNESNVASHSKRWHKTIKRIDGRGACFAMILEDWYTLHGYDERIEGWGADDDEMWKRANLKLNMLESNEYPLFHINHAVRKGSASFPIKSAENLSCSDWNSEHWGIA